MKKDNEQVDNSLIMKEDMPNWRRFVESVTGRSYGSVNREPPKKGTKPRTGGRDGQN